MLRLHDTALGSVVDVVPRQAGRLSMYICGPTVYDVAHIGHGRATLTYDVLRRYLEWSGVEVRHVSNITDIDDNIIKRAASEGCSTQEMAHHYEAAWWDAMDRLGVLRPHEVPHATDYVEPMVDLIERLVGRGVGYETPDGVYLESSQIPGYGLLARQSAESLRAGARVGVDDQKRSPTDFALWKKARSTEPAWPSPWGPGRPGWHTECVVMSLDLLGEDFDLHGGGADLAFPHHENERAQAVALDRRFARHWMHHAFILSGGEKMSKSLDNFTSLPDLLERTDPRAYRMLVLRAHYRTPIDVGPDTIADAEEALARLDSLRRRMAPATDVTGGAGTPYGAAHRSAPGTKVTAGGIHGAVDTTGSEGAGPGPDPEVLAEFRRHMDDDLNTPRATALIFEQVRRANSAADGSRPEEARRAAATAFDMAGALGLEPGGTEIVIDEESAQLAARRDRARAERDFAASDALRDELAARGWVVEDSAQGTRLRR
ncbi:MAG: cysteine--tRNA ligase [Acidimicrobiales bacterium]